MKNFAKYSVDKAITIFMAVMIVAIFGVVSFTRLTTDLFPSMNIPYAVVVTTYIGASPSEVEEVVSKTLEEAFATTTNIKGMVSMSQENVSIMMLEFESDSNMDSAVIEMRENLDMVLSSLPDEVGNPMIIKINPDMMPIMQFSISVSDDTIDLTKLVEETVLPQVERIGGVASVSVSGSDDYEISIVLDQNEIDLINTFMPVEFQIDREYIATILQAQNFEFPVGYVNLEGVNYLVRVGDEFGTKEELEELVMLNYGGLIVTLDDIANVTEVQSNVKEYSKVNGENAITLTIQKSSNFATTDVTKEIIATMDELADLEGLEYTVILNQGEYIEQATGSVTDNLLVGALLAVVVLFLFLRSFRATFIVGIAIPISLLFAIVLIYLSGITLNIVSLGGLALGIGMLVDNSIVVMENIFRLKKEGYSNKEAAIKGTAQVGGAITASTLTTISVFIPIIFIEGFIREIFIQMAMTITFSLLASLMIALTLVPSVASKVFKEDDNDTLENKGLTKLKNGYEKVFKFAFKFKAIILPVVLVLFVGSILLAMTNGFEYFPESDEGQLSITISNPNIDPLSYDDFILELDSLGDDISDLSSVDTVGITLGGGQMMFLGVTSADSATVNVILDDDRDLSTTDVLYIIDDMLLNDYSSIEYSISGSQTMTQAFTGSGVQIQLSGYELETLKEEAIKITEILQTVEGLKDIDNGIGKEVDEVKITVRKADAIAFGITTAQVMGFVSENLQGNSAVTTISIDGDAFEVFVYDENYIDDQEYTKEEIENFFVGMDMFNPTVPVFLHQVADVDDEYPGSVTITRENGSRVLTISADFEDGYNASLVSIDVEDALNDYNAPDGYKYIILGENEEIMEAFEVLGLAVLLGIALIYMIMASQFQSLKYPFIIMFTIPLAFTGGFLILFFAGMPVSVVSFIGLIVLTGVVVNNGIVLVDYTNQLRNDGYKIEDALLEAGRTRLRPIIMTALTTILALSTMALGIGEGAEMMQPMAVTTIGGLIYATILTLIVVPLMYFIITKYSRIVFGVLGIVTIVLVTIVLVLLFNVYWVIYVGTFLVLGISALLVFVPKKGDVLIE